MKGNLKNSYSQVYSVINQLKIHEYSSIPDEIIFFIDENRNKDYNFQYDSSKNLKEQNFSNEAVKILVNLYFNYIASTNEKSKLEEILKLKSRKKEINSKKENIEYDLSDMLKKRKKANNNINIEVQKSIVIIKEKWYKRLFGKIKNILKRNIVKK